VRARNRNVPIRLDCGAADMAGELSHKRLMAASGPWTSSGACARRAPPKRANGRGGVSVVERIAGGRSAAARAPFGA
jgi:hypothetical protein